MEKLNIPLHGPSLNIVRRCGPALREVLRSKFGCEATIEGVDFESDVSVGQLRRSPVDPVKKYSFLLRGGVELSVWKADLTTFKVDAVVNAANELLNHGGGLAYALSIAGGSQIQKESENYINKYGHLGTGEAIALDAGCLPCKKIIHAVGPCLTKHPSRADVSGAKGKLEMAIESILHQVEKHHLQSVAIPAISSGLFNFPLPECADTIVAAVKRYYESSQSHLPQEIRLANHDDITVSEMERACLQLLGPSSSPSSSKGATRSQTPDVQIGKVHLTLKKGKIEEQLTDVIVNTTSLERDLKIGEISNALLLKAGNQMQNEIYKVSFTGRLLITNSYNLKCKKVFHTVCLEKWRSQHNTTPQKVLYDSVTDCLKNAANNGYKSIAFPAIGTGNLGFDKKEVAAIMANAVVDFAPYCPTEIDVMFIIYPSDDQTYKAFEDQMVTLRQRAPRPQETGAMMYSSLKYEHRNDSHSSRAPTPQITLGGPSEEPMLEAKRWLSGLFYKSYSLVNISNNFIQHFGEREHLQLYRLMEKGVVIEELFEGGHARISVMGNSSEDAVVAGFQVEAMLCNVQEEFVRDEEDAMCEALGEKRVDFERKKVDSSSNRLSAFKKEGLWIVKVDKVVNPSLKSIYDQKATQLRCSTQKMFQLIPAQFCEMVCKIGFHAEYAPPGEAAYGEGIYFAGTVKKAMEVWKEQEHPKEEYLYFVEAEVLTGISTRGTPGLILPPPVREDPLLLHDSVSGGPDVSVIFSGYQALPTYIITCKRY
ncbi:protein mono-ADP-ribosyltransferase PARP9 [Gymnodraco acuticeps]|uniref:Protein mono-ADP-ribosyltransferase PARP9 n=1 Tax=Gymnodraco acuticeps TaxID=8218 RepID=A0A6P8TKN6_GYMAC|nr:protein mono-ADP-ribosyltransferase PARP9 [Gymnodraco acuticeps]